MKAKSQSVHPAGNFVLFFSSNYLVKEVLLKVKGFVLNEQNSNRLTDIEK